MQNTEHLCMGCMSENKGEQVCSICGFDSAAPQDPSQLKLRTRLANRYLVGKVTGQNGEGLTYLGWDTATDSIVKIREYFPTGLCSRNADGSVTVNEEVSYVYNEGIIEFLDLAKRLSNLGNMPAIYPVADVFEENKTAYYINEFYPGISLREFLIRNGGVLRWEQARPLFLPLISSIAQLHNAGIIHRGISPETLVVGRDGKIRLTDFCISAARSARSEMTAQLFAGFAAIEQYGFDKSTQQGTWTDVYGFAATLFRTLIGNPPPEANQRVTSDNMSFPQKLAEAIPRNVLIAMANALQILPEDRTSTMDELRKDLQTVSDQTGAVSAVNKTQAKKSKASSRKYALLASGATTALFALIGLILVFTVFKNQLFNKQNNSSVVLPSEVSVGDSGNYSSTEKLYSVPNMVGQTYADVAGNTENQKAFTFKIVKKEFSDKIDRGKIVTQSVAANTNVKKGTEIQVTISLGPEMVTIPKTLKGKTRQEAYIELLELGFNPSSIVFMEKKGTEATKEEVVLEADPGLGTKVSPDAGIIIFYNTNLITDDVSSDSYGNYYDNSSLY